MGSKIVASELLAEAVKRHNIPLSLLIADTAFWASPEFHYRLMRDTRSAAVFPMVRRARISQGEQRGQVDSNGVRLDDNSYANRAIKKATGLGKSAEGFEACHIWPLTCYDERYHTAVANIVLLPRALASLSDHLIEIQMALQYRAFELYGWHPENKTKPVKPNFYPSKWKGPQPDPIKTWKNRRFSAPSKSSDIQSTQEKIRSLKNRLAIWSLNPCLNVHKIIALVVNSHSGINQDILIKMITEHTKSKNPAGSIASLLTNSGNAYGRFFMINNEGKITIHPEVEKDLRSFTWHIDY